MYTYFWIDQKESKRQKDLNYHYMKTISFSNFLLLRFDTLKSFMFLVFALTYYLNYCEFLIAICPIY